MTILHEIAQPGADEFIPCYLAQLAVDETIDAHIVLLRDMSQQYHLALAIGAYEAACLSRPMTAQAHIESEHKRQQPVSPAASRPLSHDVLLDMVRATGGTITAIRIESQHNEVYVATLMMTQNGTVHHIDCRPSDALAVLQRLNSSLQELPDQQHVPLLIRQDLLEPSA